MSENETVTLPVAWGSRVITQRGIWLPYRDERRRWNSDYTKLEVYQVTEGTVFVTESDLEELSNQERWDSSFGSALLLGHLEGIALEQAGLAIKETRGGYFRSDTLQDFLAGLDIE